MTGAAIPPAIGAAPPPEPPKRSVSAVLLELLVDLAKLREPAIATPIAAGVVAIVVQVSGGHLTVTNLGELLGGVGLVAAGAERLLNR